MQRRRLGVFSVCLSAKSPNFLRKKQYSICAGKQKHTECDKRDQPKCAACGGPHPSMTNSCTKYTLAKIATETSVKTVAHFSAMRFELTRISSYSSVTQACSLRTRLREQRHRISQMRNPPSIICKQENRFKSGNSLEILGYSSVRHDRTTGETRRRSSLIR